MIQDVINNFKLKLKYVFFCVFFSSSLIAEEIKQINIYKFLGSPNNSLESTFTVDIINPEDIYNTSAFNLIRSGPEGQYTNIYTRGTDSRDTLITFNGIPIKDHSTPNGADDLGQYSFLGVNRLEVIKGPMSSIFGPDALGGVINFNSEANTENYIDVSYGSYQTLKTKLKIGYSINDTILDIQLLNNSSNGISVISGEEKDGYNNQAYNIQTLSKIGNYLLKTSFQKTDNKSALDDTTDNSNYTSKWQWDNQYLSLQNNDEEFTFNNSTHNRSYNKSGDIDKYYNNTKTILAKKTIHLDNADMNLGLENNFNKANFNTTIDSYISSVDKNFNNHGVYSNFTIKTPFGLTLAPGFRYDQLSEFKNQITKRIGFDYQEFYGSVGTSFSTPSVYELYGKDNYGFLGNPNLLPENAVSYEAGYKNKFFRITVFESKIKNLITYNNSRYFNDSGISERKGIELNFNLKKSNDLNISNKSSYIIARDSSGLTLKRRPKVQNNFLIDYKNFYSSINTFGSYYDTHFTNYSRTVQPPVTLVDLGYKINFENKLLYASIQNILDKSYTKPNGYQQPGRNFIIGLKINYK